MTALALRAADPQPFEDATDATPLEVGLMRLCGRDLAVPAASVREVVPMPERLHPSFSAAGISIGSIVIRGRVIPVLDIAGQLGFGARDGGPSVVLILRRDGALIGLVMDMVSGLARVPRHHVQPFTLVGDGAGQLVSSSFPHGDRLVGLIDPEAVFALPGVPLAREGTPAETSGGVAIRSAVVLIGVGETNLAIDASMVVATVPHAQLGPSPMPDTDWVGVVQYLGQEVPVIEDLELFGLSGRAAERPSGAVIILRFDETRMLGLRIDRVRRILPIEERAMRPLPQALAEQLSLFAGAIVDHEGLQNLLLDRDALLRCEPLRMIGALSREKAKTGSAGAPTSPGASESGARQSYVVFRAGRMRRAAPLAGIKQIIRLPRDCAGMRRAGSALQGVSSYNGAPLPLLDLADGAADPSIAPEERVVLVVEKDGTYRGLIVDRLETIARAAAKPLPGSASGHFIEARIADQPESVTLCELAEEADRRV